MKGRLRILVESPWTLAMLVLLYSQWETWVAGPTHLVGPLWATGASLGVGSLLLAGRRRSPLVVQTAMAVATGAPWLVWGSSQTGASFLLGVLSTYAVGRWGRRPAAFLGVPVAAAWTLLQIARDPLQAGVAAGWGWVLYAVISWAAGAWVRQNIELNGRHNAERVARSRAELAEQRLGIARDLHDVLANSLGVMVVHAEAAEEILADNPERAAQAMRRVQTSGRRALEEVRGLLGQLHADHDQPPKLRNRISTTEPERLGSHSAPGLTDIDALVTEMRSAGLPLRLIRRDDRPVAADVSEVIYRLVQESLTNTLRHAGRVDTRVRIEVTAETVTVEVTDDGSGEPRDRPSGGGHGLTGMRERVQLLGGTFEAGTTSNGGFTVDAEIPLRPPALPGSIARGEIDRRRSMT